jgi:hypothetical protein
MNIDCSREKVIKVIEDYLKGAISPKKVSDWALDVIRASNWEKLPEDVSGAIHLLFDLHDEGQAWCPSREELEQCKAELKKNSSTE